jgi:hypothetical protein
MNAWRISARGVYPLLVLPCTENQKQRRTPLPLMSAVYRFIGYLVLGSIA